MSLGVVVPYCSNEDDLIDQVLDSLKQVSQNIVVVCMSHFFNGEEDVQGIEKVQSLVQPGIKAKVIPWKEIPGAPQNFWIKEMRLYGFQALEACKWVMFVDSDEVLRNPISFLRWYDTIKENEDTSYKLSNYWYFLSKNRRSKVVEDSIALVPKQCLHFGSFRLTSTERENLAASASLQIRHVKDLDGNVMFDHFSWVRSKEILLRKVGSWGHRYDRDWISLVTTAFQGDILSTPDFVHGYEYDIVP